MTPVDRHPMGRMRSGRRLAWVAVTGAVLALPGGALADSWNPQSPAAPAAISTSESLQSYLGAGVDSAGVVTAAWIQQTAAPTDYGAVVAARLPADGSWQPIGGRVTLASTDLTTFPQFPAVAVDPAGNAVVAWGRVPMALGTTTIEARRYSAASGTWGPVVTISDAATQGSAGTPDSLRVAADSIGNFTVVWRTARPADSGKLVVVAKRWSASSAGWAPGIPAVLGGPCTSMSNPAVSGGPSGTATVAWSQWDGCPGNPPNEQLVSNEFSGSWLGSPTVAYDAGGTQVGGFLNKTKLATSASGVVTAVWTDNRQANCSNVMCVQSKQKAAGVAWGALSEVAAAPSSGGFPSPLALVSDPAGNVTAAWTRWVAGQGTVQARRRLASGGGSWEATTTNVSTAAVDAYYPALAVDDAGNVTAAWNTWLTGTYDLPSTQASHLSPAGSGTWDPPTTLQSGGMYAATHDGIDAPVVVAAPTSGVATALWAFNDGVHSVWTVEGSRYASDPAPTPTPTPNPAPAPASDGSSSAASVPAGGTTTPANTSVTVPDALANAGLPVSPDGVVRLPLACPAGLPGRCTASGYLTITTAVNVPTERGRAETARRLRTRVIARFKGFEIASGTTVLNDVRLRRRIYAALRKAGVRRTPADLHLTTSVAGEDPATTVQRIWLRIPPLKKSVPVTG